MTGELFTLGEVICELQSECIIAGSQRKWARQHGFSDAFVSAVLRGRKRPSTDMLKELQFRAVELFEAVVTNPPQIPPQEAPQAALGGRMGCDGGRGSTAAQGADLGGGR